MSSFPLRLFCQSLRWPQRAGFPQLLATIEYSFTLANFGIPYMSNSLNTVEACTFQHSLHGPPLIKKLVLAALARKCVCSLYFRPQLCAVGDKRSKMVMLLAHNLFYILHNQVGTPTLVKKAAAFSAKKRAIPLVGWIARWLISGLFPMQEVILGIDGSGGTGEV